MALAYRFNSRTTHKQAWMDFAYVGGLCSLRGVKFSCACLQPPKADAPSSQRPRAAGAWLARDMRTPTILHVCAGGLCAEFAVSRMPLPLQFVSAAGAAVRTGNQAHSGWVHACMHTHCA